MSFENFGLSEKTETFRLLSSMVSTLTEQLQEKDRQIEALTKELAEERQHSRERSDKLTAQLAVLADQAQKRNGGSFGSRKIGNT